MMASSPPSSSIALRSSGETGVATRSGRLLGRHPVHLAGGKVEAHALDAVEIGAGHPHEARLRRIVDRMNFAVLIDAGLAGIKPVFLDGFQFGLARIAAA